MAIIECSFYSYSLQLSTSIRVILPQRSDIHVQLRGGNNQYQVLWLLHGLSDDHTIWTRRTSIERYADQAGIGVIMPAVDRSFYTDMAEGNRYWTYISEELPEIARGFFPLSPTREDNFVAGLSMGGYGAFKLALSHPDRYAAAASLSGAVDVTQVVKGTDEWRREMRRIFGDVSAVKGSQHDLFHLAKQVAELDAEKPRLYQCCGRQDFLYEDNLRFRDYAQQLSLDLTYDEGAGEHEWGYWDRQIQKVLDWLPLKRIQDYVGLISIDSLVDSSLIDQVEVLKTVRAINPSTSSQELHDYRIVRVPEEEIARFSERLSQRMLPAYICFFVNENTLIVVFKGKTFRLDKHDRSTWEEMVNYGKSVQVNPTITKNLPLEIDRFF